MTIGAVADIHGNFDALTNAISRHPDVPLWICVGDLASRTGAYPETSKPLYWIKGNNEDFDRIAEWEAGAQAPRDLRYIRNGTAAKVGPLKVAALGGTFAPTWFETKPDALPHTPKDDKRRHFVRDEADACKRLRAVDIFMTHEAARPFIIVDEPKPGGKPPLDGARGVPSGSRGTRRHDAGKLVINDVLATMQPRLHLCGHHHRFAETVREGVRSVCIDRINRSYLLIDAETLEYRKIEQ